MSLRETLATVDGLLGKLSVAIQSAASLAFVVSALVLAGALAAGQRARIYEAVVLKVLGATRGRLLGALALEFALLGLATAGCSALRGGIRWSRRWSRASCSIMSFRFFPAQALASRSARSPSPGHRADRNLAGSGRKARAAPARRMTKM